MTRLVLAAALFSGVVVHDGFAQNVQRNLRGYTIQEENGAVFAVPPRGRSLPKLRYVCRFSCGGVGIVAYSGTNLQVRDPSAWVSNDGFCGFPHARLNMYCNSDDAGPYCNVSAGLRRMERYRTGSHTEGPLHLWYYDYASRESDAVAVDCAGTELQISSSGVNGTCVRQNSSLALECRFVPQSLASARRSPWTVNPPVRGGKPDQIIAQGTAAAGRGDSARAKSSDGAKVSAPVEPAAPQGNAAPATE